jgi:plasmid stability protein
MVQCMGHIQIRNVPDDVHRTLKARAAKEGVSLSEYLRREVLDFAQRPTLAEVTERIRSRPMIRSEIPAAELIREAREERERELDDRLGRIARR